MPRLLPALLALAPLTAAAAEPLFAYQGRLLDADGAPLSGARDLDVWLHDASSGGTELWHARLDDVAVTDGYFTVHLHGPDLSARPLAGVFDAEDEVFISLGVDGGPAGSRTAIAWTPLAARAGAADAVHASGGYGGPAGEHTWSGTDILLRSFPFTKRRDDTGILVLWYDNLRCLGDAIACRWEVRFRPAAGGAATGCAVPGRIYADYYGDVNASTAGVWQNLHLPTTVAAACHQLLGSTGPLPAGDWLVEVWLTQHPHSSAEGVSWTGWSDTPAQINVIETL